MLSYILAPSKNSVKENVLCSVIFLEVSPFIEERRRVKELTRVTQGDFIPGDLAPEPSLAPAPRCAITDRLASEDGDIT